MLHGSVDVIDVSADVTGFKKRLQRSTGVSLIPAVGFRVLTRTKPAVAPARAQIVPASVAYQWLTGNPSPSCKYFWGCVDL